MIFLFFFFFFKIISLLSYHEENRLPYIQFLRPGLLVSVLFFFFLSFIDGANSRAVTAQNDLKEQHLSGK